MVRGRGRAINAAAYLKQELAKIAGDGVAELDANVDRLIGDLRSAQSILRQV